MILCVRFVEIRSTGLKQMDKKDGMSKTVTVVIPIYNVEKYLNRALKVLLVKHIKI